MLYLTSSNNRIELGVYRSPPKKHQATELLILARLQWNCLSKFLHLPSLSSRSSANCQTFVDMHAYVIRIYVYILYLYIYCIHIERERKKERERERESFKHIVCIYTYINANTFICIHISKLPASTGYIRHYVIIILAMHIKNTHTHQPTVSAPICTCIWYHLVI